jgi:hypothetical protein
MADKRATSDAPQDAPKVGGDGSREERAGPTIDLTATEVPPKVADTVEQPASAPMMRLGIAAVGGVAIAALIFAALWRTGVIAVGLDNDAGLAKVLNIKIATLERQVSELQSRPQPQPSSDVTALSERLGKIEGTLAQLAAAGSRTVDRLTDAENVIKSLGVALTALSHRTDNAVADAASAHKAADAAEKSIASLRAATTGTADSVPRADVEALQKRVAALETQAKELETQVKAAHEAITSNSDTDNAARLALSADVLRSAVNLGTPYADELATVKTLGGDAKALAPLEPFARTGVPTALHLAQQLTVLMPQLLRLAGAPSPNADLLAKLEANVVRLVRIRPLNAPQGNDPATVLARLEVDAANADIPAALADLAKLPEKTRAPAATWIEKAEARQAALTAAAQFAAQATRALRP